MMWPNASRWMGAMVVGAAVSLCSLAFGRWLLAATDSETVVHLVKVCEALDSSGGKGASPCLRVGVVLRSDQDLPRLSWEPLRTATDDTGRSLLLPDAEGAGTTRQWSANGAPGYHEYALAAPVRGARRIARLAGRVRWSTPADRVPLRFPQPTSVYPQRLQWGRHQITLKSVSRPEGGVKAVVAVDPAIGLHARHSVSYHGSPDLMRGLPVFAGDQPEFTLVLADGSRVAPHGVDMRGSREAEYRLTWISVDRGAAVDALVCHLPEAREAREMVQSFVLKNVPLPEGGAR